MGLVMWVWTAEAVCAGPRTHASRDGLVVGKPSVCTVLMSADTDLVHRALARGGYHVRQSLGQAPNDSYSYLWDRESCRGSERRHGRRDHDLRDPAGTIVRGGPIRGVQGGGTGGRRTEDAVARGCLRGSGRYSSPSPRVCPSLRMAEAKGDSSR